MLVASPDCAESFFAGRVARCVGLRKAASLADLSDILREQTGPTALDLIGHSTRDHHLLRLGRTPIDMLDPAVARFFRALPRGRFTAVRLLGCQTAVTESGRRTLRMLAHTLRVPVWGTLKPLLKTHYDENGFNPAFTHVLAEAASLRNDEF